VAQPSQLAQLAQRKSLLVARSAELRRDVALDLARLHSSTVWVDTGMTVLRSGKALWPLFAGTAGMFAGGNRQGWLGKAIKFASWIGVGKKVAGLWRSAKEGR
jgi:hypothetical protein